MRLNCDLLTALFELKVRKSKNDDPFTHYEINKIKSKQTKTAVETATANLKFYSLPVTIMF